MQQQDLFYFDDYINESFTPNNFNTNIHLEDNSNNPSNTSRINDFGSKIGGARKDVYGTRSTQNAASIYANRQTDNNTNLDGSLNESSQLSELANQQTAQTDQTNLNDNNPTNRNNEQYRKSQYDFIEQHWPIKQVISNNNFNVFESAVVYALRNFAVQQVLETDHPLDIKQQLLESLQTIEPSEAFIYPSSSATEIVINAITDIEKQFNQQDKQNKQNSEHIEKIDLADIKCNAEQYFGQDLNHVLLIKNIAIDKWQHINFIGKDYFELDGQRHTFNLDYLPANANFNEIKTIKINHALNRYIFEQNWPMTDIAAIADDYEAACAYAVRNLAKNKALDSDYPDSLREKLTTTLKQANINEFYETGNNKDIAEVEFSMFVENQIKNLEQDKDIFNEVKTRKDGEEIFEHADVLVNIERDKWQHITTITTNYFDLDGPDGPRYQFTTRISKQEYLPRVSAKTTAINDALTEHLDHLYKLDNTQQQNEINKQNISNEHNEINQTRLSSKELSKIINDNYPPIAQYQLTAYEERILQRTGEVHVSEFAATNYAARNLAIHLIKEHNFSAEKAAKFLQTLKDMDVAHDLVFTERLVDPSLNQKTIAEFVPDTQQFVTEVRRFGSDLSLIHPEKWQHIDVIRDDYLQIAGKKHAFAVKLNTNTYHDFDEIQQIHRQRDSFVSEVLEQHIFDKQHNLTSKDKQLQFVAQTMLFTDLSNGVNDHQNNANALNKHNEKPNQNISTTIIYEKNDQSQTPLIEFKAVNSQQVASEYIKYNQLDLIALHKFNVEAQRVTNKDIRSLNNRVRQGKNHREGRDIPEYIFQKTFGFRAGEFGNSVPHKERQEMLNNAYDALMDLAAAIDVHPKALSLDGKLAISFGARGLGGINAAMAHYEPNLTVINLTRKQGAGCLAHEWFHALDHHLGKLKAVNATKMDDNSSKHTFLTEDKELLTNSFATQGIKEPNITQEQHNKQNERNENHEIKLDDRLQASFANLVRTLEQSPMMARAKAVDASSSNKKAYWSTNAECAARAFESYVIATLADKDRHNDFLANVATEDKFVKGKDRYVFPNADELPAIKQAFNQVFTNLQTHYLDSTVNLANNLAVNPLTSSYQQLINTDVLAKLDKLHAQIKQQHAQINQNEQSQAEAIKQTTDNKPAEQANQNISDQSKQEQSAKEHEKESITTEKIITTNDNQQHKDIKANEHIESDALTKANEVQTLQENKQESQQENNQTNKPKKRGYLYQYFTAAEKAIIASYDKNNSSNADKLIPPPTQTAEQGQSTKHSRSSR